MPSNMQKFHEIIAHDKSLADKLVQAANQGKSQEEIVNLYINLAKSKGITIAMDDIKREKLDLKKFGELNDEDLGGVAGGGIFTSLTCNGSHCA